MICKFEKPIVPNYIRTDKGSFALTDFTDEEFKEYISLWTKTIKERRERQMEDVK